MNEVNPYLWAKKIEKNGRYLWLPLRQHLIDTFLVSGRLWELWLSDSQKKIILNSMDEPNEDTAKQLIEFLGAVHDIAKATPAFQIKQGYQNSTDLDIRLLERFEKDGFTEITNLKLPSGNKSHHALAGQSLLYWYGVKEDIASIVGAHHGKPLNEKWQYEEQKSYLENYFQIEFNTSSIYQKWDKTQRDIFQWALESSGFKQVSDLPNISQVGQVILSGLLIMADWISSNEDFFPLLGVDELEVVNQETRFISGWEKWFKNYPWQTTSHYHDNNTLYLKRFDFYPREIQATLSNIIEESIDPGIFILEAPMGIGKTEAALVGVEQLAAKTGCSGMFFGLPTQATSNGIFPRINSWLTSISIEDNESFPIRLAHGKAALNKDFSSLARNIDIDGDGSVFVNEWFSGRKTSSLDDFVVGTVDQFLLLALKQKHLALRHLGFSRKVVVLDEVHAYDAYMNQYLLRAIQWLGAYGIPVIILSATLPADRRSKLIENYIRGQGEKVSKKQRGSDPFITDAYPLITYTDGKQIKQVRDLKNDDMTKIEIRHCDEEHFEELIDQLCKSDGIIGIIVNTVKRAQAIASQCVSKYGSEYVELLHSNFVATDRIKKEIGLMKMIGKGAIRPKKKIIIGTQVMEQSLDIDFDVLISDLAPMDLLIQRVGRLHRHDIRRPEQFINPVLYVLGANENLDFEKGSEFIYGGYLLARTQYYLPSILTLPNDISKLVQKVYGDNEIELSNELEEKYHDMKVKHEDKIANKENKASVYKLDRPNPKNSRHPKTLIGWLNYSAIDKGEEHASAQVRDTNETIEVVAVKKVGDGYGLFEDGKDLSGRIDDNHVSKILAQHTLRLPYALSHPKIIDSTIDILEKENNKFLADWQNQAWLKGSLGIIFDEEGQYYLNGYLLKYDASYGLTYEKEEKDGEV